MADIVSAETRSKMMASIHRRDTKPEIMVRKLLHAAGFRFRLDVRALPGSPDIVLRKWRTVIFIHGCFWHRHGGCLFASTPSTRREFWQAKFETNVVRDQRNAEASIEQGWKVAIVWECGLHPSVRADTIKGLFAFIRCPAPPLIRSDFPETPPRPI